MFGLILEGGGMRGAFTAGVLDFWMSKGLYFDNVYGVSAGACQACSYLCRQPGRGIRIWLNYLNDPGFCSLRSLLTTGDMFGAKLNYDLIPRKLDPLDNDTYVNSGAKLTAVVTDLRTGEAVYAPIRDMFADMAAIQASASLPLISNIVQYNGRPSLDGGVADSIPLRRAIADGCGKNVLVLTQAPGYRKAPNKALNLMRVRYAKYPAFIEAVASRHIRYNETLDFIQAEAEAGRLFVIRPDVAPDIGRVEKDPGKLQHLHDVGFAIAEREYEALMEFLN